MHVDWSMTWIRFLPPVDRLDRAFPEADHAGLTFLRVDVVGDDVTKHPLDLLQGEEILVVVLPVQS